MSKIQSIPVTSMNGTSETLDKYLGKVVLIVNVASKCGLTPQYDALEKIYRQYHEEGLEILGFPANDFGAQEPGTNAEIEQFCKLTYDVSFPMFQKITVTGEKKHPLYSELIAAAPIARKESASDFEKRLAEHGLKRAGPSEVLWNFEKFLLNRKGKVVARFAPEVTPDSDMIVEEIETQLKS